MVRFFGLAGAVTLLLMATVASAQVPAPVKEDSPAPAISAADTFSRGVKAKANSNYAEAVKWYRLAADQGNAAAQFNLGFMYANGQGVPQDYTEALKWYRLGADQGYADAQFNLGGMYAKGQGVPRDYTEAVKWYRLAAEQGQVEAQYNLGIMYVIGQKVPQDSVEAYFWLNLAAIGGGNDAINARDTIVRLMTPDDISEAQRRSREWFARHKKD